MKFLLAILLTLLTFQLNAQSTSWLQTSTPQHDRYDDVFFMDADTGWAIAPYVGWLNMRGRIEKTTDGGQSWTTVRDSVGDLLRCVSFFDAQTGFIGNLETGQSPADTAIMLHTQDGGLTWDPVPNLPGPRPGGVCGMHAVTDSLMYAVGRYYGPAGIYKTTDKGASWTYMAVDSIAGGLVDVHFWTPDSGIVVGSSGVDFADSSGVIIATYDGGQSWKRVYVTEHDERICWKISFPSRNVGYVSIQPFGSAWGKRFIKTTDGGFTWNEYNFGTGTYSAQGIGFINDSVGWIGGHWNGFANPMTTDGGQTWTNDVWGQDINRFRIFNDSLAFACGEFVWKFNGFILAGLPGQLPSDYKVSLLYPNPTTDRATIEVTIPAALQLEMRVFDPSGRECLYQISGEYAAGTHQMEFGVEDFPAGTYLAQIQLGNYMHTQRFTIAR